jgi:uncharacterized protein YPO0396
MTEMSQAEIEQAVKAAVDSFWNDCKGCRIRIALLSLAAELELAKAGRVQAENERLRAENERDRLADTINGIDGLALGALAAAGECTPSEGYNKAGWNWMVKHIGNIVASRDRIRTQLSDLQAERDLHQQYPPVAGAMPWRLQIAAPIVGLLARENRNDYGKTEICHDALRYADALLAAAQAGGK